MSPAKYRFGLDYPREGFVQRAIDRHFAAAGYHTMDGGSSDLACKHPQTGHKWVVEAKGETADVGPTPLREPKAVEDGLLDAFVPALESFHSRTFDDRAA